jgi:hypothetical protein
LPKVNEQAYNIFRRWRVYLPSASCASLLARGAGAFFGLTFAGGKPAKYKENAMNYYAAVFVVVPFVALVVSACMAYADNHPYERGHYHH